VCVYILDASSFKILISTVMADMELSLDEIIKKRNITAPGGAQKFV